jgi:hypothetical protein
MKRISIAIAALAASACVGAQEVPSQAGERSDGQRSDTDESVAQRAIDALAQELGIAKEEIEVDTVRAVDWPDSSIGCPKPGQAYLQVITPGHKITLRAEGKVHVVHEARGRAFVCEQVKPYALRDRKIELPFGRQTIEARKDLAARLGVPEDEIKVIAVQERTWDDASLGCPEPGKTVPPGQVKGWALTLSHKSRHYSYHADSSRTIPCPSISVE